MGKRNKQKRRKRSKKLKPLRRQETKRWWSAIPIGWRVFLGVGVFLGFWSAFFSLLPSISVSPSTPSNPSAVMTTSFTLSNDGYLSLVDVKIVCGVNSINFRGGGGIQGIGFTTPRLAANKLEPNEKYTFSCEFILNEDAPIVSADIVILVSYQPSFLFWRQTSKHRFITHRTSGGRLRWFHQPLSK